MTSRTQISRETLDQVRGFTADVIGRYVSLRTSGSALKGLCPFHGDRKPSLSVKGEHFRCFSCGIAGDVFQFVMLAEKVSFPDSVRIAAEVAGINVKGEKPEAIVTLKEDRCIERELDYWRQKALRETAAELRKRDAFIRTARANFDAVIIDENPLFHALHDDTEIEEQNDSDRMECFYCHQDMTGLSEWDGVSVWGPLYGIYDAESIHLHNECDEEMTRLIGEIDDMGVAYAGYSSLEYWYEQLVRDDLYSDLELWLQAEGESHE